MFFTMITSETESQTLATEYCTTSSSKKFQELFICIYYILNLTHLRQSRLISWLPCWFCWYLIPQNIKHGSI